MKYQIEKIGTGTWLIEEYDENVKVYMYLLAGNREAVLIDAGMGMIPLKEAVSSLTDLPVKVLLTHGHIDHIGGTGAFPEVYLHEKDMATYRLHDSDYRGLLGNYDIPALQKSLRPVRDGTIFDLGGRSLRVIHTPGHSVGSVCVLDQENGWLFTGDTCCRGHVLLHMDYSASVEVYEESVKKLLEERENYNLTWPAHHDKPVQPEILCQYLEAAQGIISGNMCAEKTVNQGRCARLLTYHDIGIVYPV
ncbi:MBL fold metallo-hydrolase [Diplocloster agilis]|uniref:MBL fold metallo-hydrolase n=1 Tax=Diplocloster agilis TaxID=2850323 RepID=A0A949JWZ9_9FIRM|nr:MULTISPECIES: MBL fold metallo-hydrolase [Lachnospiraceae]MBU9735626.1 MBL fold metallo-hydrolase [Diplocloster agilis]MCU6732364.1 MBL fold metallo-hydrolase [Suonthocola fibrivorans]SCI44547.1 Probable polyketide biosynthesis zinc-dependent hydrolase BaeB [uncultured Clostridium sp.]